jgi:hypothetical protein
MATTHNDYAHEKGTAVEYAENHESPNDTTLELTKTRTLEGIDMNNTQALKGDDSDGKVKFGVRGTFAAIFLAGLYTGKQTTISASIGPAYI